MTTEAGQENNILTDANYSNNTLTGINSYENDYNTTEEQANLDSTTVEDINYTDAESVGITTDSSDNSTENISGCQSNNDLIGDSNNNTINSNEGKDTLTGGEGSDTFNFDNVSTSSLSNYDTITDLNVSEDQVVGVNNTNTNLNSITQFGSVNSLDEASIQATLNESNFMPNTSGIFTYNEQTFLVFNDEVAGFLEKDDLVIEITGVEGLTPTDNSTPEPDSFTTINVDSDFNGDLESAIASADDGDTIVMGSNTYFTDGITLDKDLTIDGQEGTIIDGGGTSASIFELTSEATGATIQDLRITNGNNGINSNGAFNLTIQNLEVDNIGLSTTIRDGQNNTGIILNRANGLQLSNTFIHDIGRKGVGVNDTDGAVVSNLTVQNINLAAQHTQSFDAAGIKFYNTNDVTVKDNNLSSINAYGIWNDTNNGTIIENNVINNVGDVFLKPDFNQNVNIAGIYDEKSVNSTVRGNNVTTVGDFLAFNATAFTTETLVLENNNFSRFELNTPDFWINEELEKLIATTENPDEANFSLIADEYFAQTNIG
jgi:hypothetical protein